MKSQVKPNNVEEINNLADNLSAATLQQNPQKSNKHEKGEIDPNVMFKLSYGLFVLSARDGDDDNACIVNTVLQLTAEPLRISVTVNKENYTRDMIMKTKEFNVSILSESAPFEVFERFGFQSGKSEDKFSGTDVHRSNNGIRYIADNTNALISGKVVDALDYGTHTLFIAEVTQSSILSAEKSATYQYYFENIKPRR